MPSIYNGNEPYIFISYAHKDSAVVLPLIEGLQNRGFRVWYDAGIEAGSEWPEYIAERLCDSAVVLAFITEAAVESQNCRREINFAIDQKKEMLVVYLEEPELSRGMQMQLGTLQAIFHARFGSDAAFLDELCKAKPIGVCKGSDAPQQAETAAAASLYAEAARLLDKKRYGRAVALLRKAAEQGNAEAQNALALCYDGGNGVKQDEAQAVYWFTKAAERGLAKAQYNLGEYYLVGYGATEDHAQAVYWYRKAAKQGFTEAYYRLGVCYLYGYGVTEDPVQANHWFTKAAEDGHAESQCNLGAAYATGNGVAPDRMKAVYWLKKAAEQGLDEAEQMLTLLGAV